MSKGCIQVKIGNNIYQFNDIGVDSSMSLNDIAKKLTLNNRNKVQISNEEESNE